VERREERVIENSRKARPWSFRTDVTIRDCGDEKWMRLDQDGVQWCEWALTLVKTCGYVQRQFDELVN
jgi:hypothetical protein